VTYLVEIWAVNQTDVDAFVPHSQRHVVWRIIGATVGLTTYYQLINGFSAEHHPDNV
jgi:hypothetical protein